MDNFQSVMLGRNVDADLTDDGWTRHFAAVQNPPRHKGMTVEEFTRTAEEIDFGIMEEHRARIVRWSPTPTSRPRSSRTTATSASGRASTTSTSTRSTVATSPSSTAPPASMRLPSRGR